MAWTKLFCCKSNRWCMLLWIPTIDRGSGIEPCRPPFSTQRLHGHGGKYGAVRQGLDQDHSVARTKPSDSGQCFKLLPVTTWMYRCVQPRCTAPEQNSVTPKYNLGMESAVQLQTGSDSKRLLNLKDPTEKLLAFFVTVPQWKSFMGPGQ